MSHATPAPFERVRGLVEPELRAAIDRLGPELRRAAAYHLGWVDRDGRPSTSRGKGLRSTLAVVGAEAAGRAADDAVPAAVAVELVHEFSLVHDDIIDGDTERRHRPAVWATFSPGEAIIVGDAIANLAQLVLLESDRPDAARATRRLASASAAMIEGQSRDMAMARSRYVSVAACSEMERLKTAELLGCAASLGACLAGASEAAIGALQRFGVELGLAFQAIDDVLGIWGDPELTGKPAGNDLREGKSSMPVALAHQRAPEHGAELGALLSSEDPSGADVARAAELISGTGAREATEELAADHLDRAVRALRSDADLGPAVDELEAIARFAADRAF